jgi:hypothetical protein
MTRYIMALITILITIGCAVEPPRPRGFTLPPALSEVFRGGELNGLQNADTPNLGMPNEDQLVSRTCRSQPIFNLDGYYLYTAVKCY